MISIVINGEQKEIKDGTTLLEAIASLKIEDKVMAAAVNMQIVKKDDWNNYKIKSGDKLELLQFVGGG
jgi:sulfur carrier protein